MKASGASRAYALATAAVLAAAAIALVVVGAREAIGYDSYWHVFIARQDRWTNFWREVRDNAHPPLFYLMLRAASRVFGPKPLVYRLVSIASTIAAAAAIAAIVKRITANRPLAAVAAAAFAFSQSAIATGLEVRAYSMCAAFTMLAFLFYLDWLAGPPRQSARAAAGFAVTASIAIVTHYSTFFFLAAAIVSPAAIAIASRAWRRRIARRIAAHPVAGVSMFGTPTAIAAGAYIVHVVLWGGGRLGHVPENMFNPNSETAARFLWRNTVNLAAIVLPGGSEFVAGINNSVQRVALLLALVVVAAGLAHVARHRTLRPAAVPIVLLLVMVGLNAIGGLTFRYPYGGAARHEFFLVPFAVVALFTLVEALRRELPRRLADRRLIAGIAACGVAASVVSWTSTFHVEAQPLFQPQMDEFRRIVPAPQAVLLDQFSFIGFFSHYHDWQWRAGADFPDDAVRQVWSLSNGPRRLTVCRSDRQWSFDMANAGTFDTIVDCAHRAGVGRVAVFRPRWWDSPPGLAAFDRARAAQHGVTPTAFAVDRDNVAAEFDVDPAVLVECDTPLARPAALRVTGNAGRGVTLAWQPVAGAHTTYVIEAGSTTGARDALAVDNGAAPTYTAAQVAPGTYYVRVRARNECSVGRPSNEIVVVVR